MKTKNYKQGRKAGRKSAVADAILELATDRAAAAARVTKGTPDFRKGYRNGILREVGAVLHAMY
jgi:hypothetical protein